MIELFEIDVLITVLFILIFLLRDWILVNNEQAELQMSKIFQFRGFAIADLSFWYITSKNILKGDFKNIS